ncbi:unnamed protein product, partial [Vitis vinifera]
MPPPRRKKWTEAEERTLIDRYGEMVSNGALAKMKTREKKYRPIALYVNSVHHVRDPIAYPWQWTWKDVSTKVQNMRHQYLLVKQKIKKPELGDAASGPEDFNWVEGITHWSNFLRYKEVFGDVPLAFNGIEPLAMVGNDENGGGFIGSNRGMEINGVLGMGFEYDGDDGEENYNNGNNRVREDGDDGFVEMEARFEHREAEREREKQRRETLGMELEKELRRQWIREWELMEKESEDRERRRREEELIEEREWEERMNRRRTEWKKRIDEMLSQHRAEMGQIQSRILHEQQNLSSQLLGIISQWSGHPTGLSDHTGASNHYLSQMMQNLHHVNGIVHGDARVEGDNQDDQFIVDG